MRDPREGVASDGTITTGAALHRVPASYEAVLAEAVAALATPGAAVLVYGSVATGQARPGSSDVDLLTVDVDPATAHDVAETLSARFAALCRTAPTCPTPPASGRRSRTSSPLSSPTSRHSSASGADARS